MVPRCNACTQGLAHLIQYQNNETVCEFLLWSFIVMKIESSQHTCTKHIIVITARQRICRKVVFSGVSGMPITQNALDLTLQDPNPSAQGHGPGPHLCEPTPVQSQPPLDSDIWWPRLETGSNLFTWESHCTGTTTGTDIWKMPTKECTLDEPTLRILLECLFVYWCIE